jgi:hypothetical protein
MCAAHLLAHQEAVIVIANEDRSREALIRPEPLKRGPQQAAALAVEKADELLGIMGPRQRPQPCPLPAR